MTTTEYRYQEAQTVEVTDGVANLALGDGYDVEGSENDTTGGVPTGVFDGSGETRYVEVTVEGYLPQPVGEVESVAYAFYAERAEAVADGAIGTAALADGSLTEEKLSESLYEALFEAPIDPSRISTALASTDYVDNKFTQSRVLKSDQIDTRGLGLNWTTSRDLATVLQGLDSGLTQLKQVYLQYESEVRVAADDSLSLNLQAEADTRATMDASLSVLLSDETTARATADTLLTASLTAETLSRNNADTALDTRVITLEDFAAAAEATYLNADGDSLVGDFTHSGTFTLFPEDSDPELEPELGIEIYSTLATYGERIDESEATLTTLTESVDSLDFSEIDGQIADGQIPDSLTRDSELSFSNLSGSIADSQVPSSFTRDSELTFSNLSGTATDEQIPSAVTRDSEVNTYVTNISGDVITSGTVNASYIDSSIATDTEVSTSISNALGGYLPLDGSKSMQGSIALPANATVDGVDVSALNDVVIIDHETRIAGLEGKDPSVDSSQLATARLTYNSSIVSSYNISSVTSSREYYNGAYTTAYTVYFSTPRSNANYSV